MTDTQEVLVVKDAEGNYYVFSHEALERARVPDDLRPRIDEQLGDVAGFLINLPSTTYQDPLKQGSTIMGYIGPDTFPSGSSILKGIGW